MNKQIIKTQNSSKTVWELVNKQQNFRALLLYSYNIFSADYFLLLYK